RLALALRDGLEDLAEAVDDFAAEARAVAQQRRRDERLVHELVDGLAAALLAPDDARAHHLRQVEGQGAGRDLDVLEDLLVAELLVEEEEDRDRAGHLVPEDGDDVLLAAADEVAHEVAAELAVLLDDDELQLFEVVEVVE